MPPAPRRFDALGRSPSTRARAAVASLALAAVGAAPASAATDTFSRTASSGWGTADSGGSWAPESGAAQFAVASGRGTIALPSGGANRAIFLPGTAVDWDVTIGARLDRTPAGGNVWVYHEVRRTGSNSYRLQAKLGTDGSTTLQGSRVISNGETGIGSAVRISGVDFRAGIVIRGQAVGANPTTLRIKAWPVGTTEPAAWAYTATDSTGPQVAGRAGLRAYVSGAITNAPITVSVDDYAANAAAPPPPPPPGDPVLVGAGDIASAGDGDTRTAALLDGIAGTVFTLGDNDQGNGTAAEFAAYYNPTWGRHKARTLLPSVGNHEYNTSGANPYFDYFGAAAGERGKGWYSRDVGAWHVVVLNTNCDFVSCSASSAAGALAARPTWRPTRPPARSPSGTTRASAAARTARTPRPSPSGMPSTRPTPTSSSTGTTTTTSGSRRCRRRAPRMPRAASGRSSSAPAAWGCRRSAARSPPTASTATPARGAC